MELWILESPKAYTSLLNSLNSEVSPWTIKHFSSANSIELLDDIQQYITFYDPDLSENSCFPVTVIVDIDNVSFIEKLIQILNRQDEVLEKLSLVCMSDFKTWSNCGSHENYTNYSISDLFSRRQSSIGALERYNLETSLHDLQKRHFRVHIVYLGLFYGDSGMDFSAIFKDVWNNSLALPMDSQTNIFLAHIHNERFLSLLRNLIRGEGDLARQFIVPAFDCSLPILDLLRTLNNLVNPSSKAPSDCSESQQSSLKDLLIGYNDATPLIHALKSQANSPFDTSTGIISEFNTLWPSFLNLNGLGPAGVLIAGPPKAGKTEISNGIASTLDVPCIDIASAALACLRWDGETVPKGILKEKLSEYRASFVSAVEAKLAEGKKPKDKNPAPSDGKIDEAVITKDFCLSLSAEINKQNVSMCLALDERTSRKGFVLDVWEMESLRDIESLTTARHALSEEGPAPQPKSLVSACVELQCTDKFLLNRLQESFGANFAKNKDAQAAVKSLETSLGAYFSTLINSEANPDEKSHPSLLKISSDETAGVALLRKDVSNGSTQEIATDLVQQLLNALPTALGWVRQAQDSGKPSVAKIEAEQDSSATSEEKSDGVNTSQSAVTGSESGRIDPKKVKGLEQYNEFLAATVLPVVAKGLIQAIRGKVDDPIRFLSDYLLEESASRQEQSEREARAKFEELLLS